MFNFGLRAHDYGKQTPPEKLAETLSQYKPASIQLALSKALSDAPKDGGLSSGYAHAIRRIFERKDIAISVLGCYINPVHPNADTREKLLRRFEEHLCYAPDFGCSLVGTETGSRNPDCSFHPDTAKPETFDLLCASLERLLKTAEKRGTIIGVEAVADQHTISSIELMKRLLDLFPSPCLKVIYDPVNLVPLSGLSETQEAFFNRAFDAFGDRIAAIHAKDFRMEKKANDVSALKINSLPAGTGDMDYKTFLSLIAQKKPGVDILLENSAPETISLMRRETYQLR
ncbi:MAG: sugar phosphate isomerase/epimerase [Treponema sp.]|jgi:sugar phosphate isomerase/epimerase|nr:sugar phosphate isomerase/epimerase [Treponema sp.]